MENSTEKQKKIDSVRIDFADDNKLPGLNREDLESLGKEDKPVLLKKGVIERNFSEHPDISREEFAQLLPETLYTPDLVLPERVRPEKSNYHHFVKYLERNNSVAIVEMSDKKDHYEVVHLQKMRNRNLKKLIAKNK